MRAGRLSDLCCVSCIDEIMMCDRSGNDRFTGLSRDIEWNKRVLPLQMDQKM